VIPFERRTAHGNVGIAPAIVADYDALMGPALPIRFTLPRAAAAAAVAAVVVIGAVAATSRPGPAANAAPSAAPAAAVASVAASAKASIWSRSETVALWTAHGFTGGDKPLNGPRRWSGLDARGTNFQALGSSSDVTEVILNYTRTAADSPADREVGLLFDSYAPSARAWFDQQLAASPTKSIDTETRIGGTKVRMFTVIALDKILVTVALYR